jgi:CheY-like chemotaxis protein
MDTVKTRILLVEDDPSLGPLLQEYLEAKGFETKLADDGKKGGDHFFKGSFDLLLLDVMMPVKDGLTLAKEQRDELKIQMTQYSNIESSIGSISSAMGGLQTDLRNATKLGIDFGASIANSTEAQSDKYKSANSAAANAISAITSLAQLNKEDAAQIAEYTQEYQNQYTIMLEQLKELQAMKDDGRTKQGKAAKEAQAQLIAQMKSLDEAYVKASKFANLQKDVKELYEEMNEELGAGNKIFQKLINFF